MKTLLKKKKKAKAFTGAEQQKRSKLLNLTQQIMKSWLIVNPLFSMAVSAFLQHLPTGIVYVL